MKAVLSPGQTSDYLGFGQVMGGSLAPPKALIADKGYDA